ncbi:uncharacterized protein AC631_03139 [Debaryomyces fabryi]|uniref:Bromo domain-containing protein n=1 Tax=Debaryomyces fabryi TaxID=58627 RepID=A0A0V1PY02_9ASCO|nr:uncharacterized protein AC631_03139 [Debaryomyces fabryi]KSA01134.1 hypothetical protein AC631_03139 [Debaryomyces fabryi]CUM55447.1 unnamed protein product [Debaryomyces fabryi]
MAAIESLDKDLVLIIIVSTINSSIKELTELTSQSTVELDLGAFLSKMNELVVAYTKAFNLAPIDVKVDKSTLVVLIKERKIADFVQVTDDILKIETNAKAFQAILSNIAVTSTLNYAKLLIKNIDDLGIIYRSHMDETGTVASKEGENDSLVDTSNTEKYTIEEENEGSEFQEGTESIERANKEVTNELEDIEGEDEQKQDEIVLEAGNDLEGQEAESIKKQENNDIVNEPAENTGLEKPLEKEQEDKAEQVEVENDDKDLEESRSEEQEENESKKDDDDEVPQEGQNEGEEQEEKEEQDESNEGEKEEKEETEETEETEEEPQKEQGDQRAQEEKENAEEEQQEEVQEDFQEEKAEPIGDKNTKNDKGEHRKTTPVDSTNNFQTPEPKLSESNAKEELRSQSSRKRSRSLSVSTPQQHKRFQHIAVNLINNIQAHRFSSPFLQPVNSKEAPDYHEVIYEPKDLKNILKSIKLKNEPPEYQLIKQLKRDILLMLANCIMYNKSDTDLVQLTKSMKNDVNNIFKLFEEAELDTK